MTTHSAEADPIESALETLEQSVSAWDSDEGGDVTAMIAAVREIFLGFDPRKDRVAASLAVVALKLLEELQSCGSVSSGAAVAAVGELTSGLRESLREINAVGPSSPGAGRGANEVVLSAPKPGAGLSLSLGVEKGGLIGEVMVQMRFLTREQVEAVLAVQAEEGEGHRQFGEIAVELGFVSQLLVDNALRMQARSLGETPEAAPNDPWGSSPL